MATSYADAEIHSTRHHEHSTRRNEAAAFALLNPAMDHDRAVEMEDDQWIVDCSKVLVKRYF